MTTIYMEPTLAWLQHNDHDKFVELMNTAGATFKAKDNGLKYLIMPDNDAMIKQILETTKSF